MVNRNITTLPVFNLEIVAGLDDASILDLIPIPVVAVSLTAENCRAAVANAQASSPSAAVVVTAAVLAAAVDPDISVQAVPADSTTILETDPDVGWHAAVGLACLHVPPSSKSAIYSTVTVGSNISSSIVINSAVSGVSTAAPDLDVADRSTRKAAVDSNTTTVPKASVNLTTAFDLDTAIDSHTTSGLNTNAISNVSGSSNNSGLFDGSETTVDLNAAADPHAHIPICNFEGLCRFEH